MKVLARQKLGEPVVAKGGGYITVEYPHSMLTPETYTTPLAQYQVPKDESWSFNEIVFFEVTSHKSGDIMFCVGLAGLIKKKI